VLGGSWIKDGKVALTNSNTLIQEDFANAVSIFDTETGASVNDQSDRNNRTLKSWLQGLNLWRRIENSKAIPASIFKLERQQLALFLNRLFAADSWSTVLITGEAQLGFASASETLVRQVQHLLLRFGIIANVRQGRIPLKNGNDRAFQLDITDDESILIFADEIGIYGKELVLERVKQAIMLIRQSGSFVIEIDNWSESALCQPHEPVAVLAPRADFKSHVSAQANSVAVLPRQFDWLASNRDSDPFFRLANSDIYWDEVVAIEYMGDKQVYDLTVPVTHNFIANDVCVHNTALCLNIAQHVAIEQKVPVAVFSLEMSKEQLVQRMLCSEASIDSNRLRTGHLHTNDWTHLAMAMGRLGEAPVFIDDSALLNVLEIRAKARRLKAEMKGLGLIIVDYIQLLQSRKPTDNRVQEVSEISRSLKTLAREINVPVVALSQLSRAVESRQNKRPMLSDLRESGSIEQDADIVMFIYRDEYYNPDSEKRGEAEIIIAKQRNGPTGTVDLLYQSSITRFLNKVQNQYGNA
jgi:replicative DNA helicase